MTSTAGMSLRAIASWAETASTASIMATIHRAHAIGDTDAAELLERVLAARRFRP